MKSLAAVLCLKIFFALGVAHAAPPWSDAPYTYFARDSKLEVLLGDFAGSFGLSLKLGSGIGSSVSGRFNAQSPGDFLNKLGSAYGFTWFVHAGTLFVDRADDQRTVAIPVTNASPGQLHAALSKLSILDGRFGWGELPEQGVVLVSGPPAYVELVERTLKTLPSVPGGQQVAVFRLKHASVDDRSVFFRDKEIKTPGVATILRNLISGAGSVRGANSDALMAIAAPARSVSHLSSEPPSPIAPSGAVGVRGAETTSYLAPPPGGGRVRAPSIEADVRVNALIVQDLPERMPIYERLIRELDVPTALIEIEAMIVDINTLRIQDLGVSWGGRWGRVGGGFRPPSVASESNTNLALNWSTGKGLVGPSTIAIDSGNFLISRIRALESAGDARVNSQPSVLTMDNLGALFDDSRTFYVRTQGERVATLTPITAGTILRVTPRVIDAERKQQVQLVVDIQDGKIDEANFVDSLPTVHTSGISTQAIVGDGETLIIGGYNNEQDINQNERIPILGQIPLIGTFFSKRYIDRQKRERLFLIKPRIVNLPIGSAIPIAHSLTALPPDWSSSIGTCCFCSLRVDKNTPVDCEP